MKEDVQYTIEDRLQIRSEAEAVLEIAGVREGKVLPANGSSIYNLISVFLKAEIPLVATSYDLADFIPAHISMSDQNLLRLTDQDKNTRVISPGGGLVLRFPGNIGQAPVIYIRALSRSKQEHLKLSSFQLPEWSRAVEFHPAFLAEDKMIMREHEVNEMIKKQMSGEKTPPEIISYLTEGNAFCIQVAPKTFSYRYPEFSLEKVAHWPLELLRQELHVVMDRLLYYKPFLNI